MKIIYNEFNSFDRSLTNNKNNKIFVKVIFSLYSNTNITNDKNNNKTINNNIRIVVQKYNNNDSSTHIKSEIFIYITKNTIYF